MIAPYYNMTCKITIGDLVSTELHSVVIESSIKKLLNTARIVLPREYRETLIKNKEIPIERKNITEIIKVGDKVQIELGYNDDNEVEFKGYVSKISADVPLVIDCEDEMFKLKKTNFTKVFPKASLKQLIEYVAPNYKTDLLDDVSLGKFTINNESAYKVLERLRKAYGLHSDFNDEVLRVGFPVSIKPSKVHEVNMNRNVRAKANDLKFVRKDDVRVLLKAISINKDGRRLTADFGDTDGAQRTLHFTDKTLSELKELAEKNYKSLSFDGYQGSLPMWGLPRTKAGESVQITDPNYNTSERDGKYLIESVRIDFNGSTGFLRTNKLGLKI